MISVYDLIKFINERCVKNKTNLKFGLFAEAFRRWLPPDKRIFVDREDIFVLFAKQNLFKTNQKDMTKRECFKGVEIIGMAIPGEQREMVSL